MMGRAALAGLALSLFWSAMAGAAVREVTLDESIETAIAHSPSLQAAREAVVASMWDVAAAAGARLPSIGAQATHTKFDKVTVAEIMGQEIPLGEPYQDQVTVTTAIPIDLWKTIGTAKDAADSAYDAARLDYAAALDSLVYQVRSSYLSVLKADAGLKVAEKGLERSNEQLRVAEAALSVGTAAKYDVLRAEVAVAAAKEQVINARNGLELALSAFRTILGGAEVEPTRPPGLEGVSEPPEEPPNLNECLLSAQERRPEILKAGVGIDLAHTGVALAGAGAKPSMGLFWNWSWQGPVSPFGGRSTQWNAVLGLKIPVLDGGITKSKVEAARSQLRAAESGSLGAKLAVDFEVRQAHTNLANAAERHQVAVANLAQAEEAHRLASLRFKEGVATSLEVIDSEVALTAAETALVTAAYDYRIARADLDKATAERSTWPEAAKGALAEYGPSASSDAIAQQTRREQ
jgi:outer membrane protein